MPPTTALSNTLLPTELLQTFRERAATYDSDNRFFSETLADLRERGYLRLFVPKELGGLGASMLDATRLQRQLAGADPAAALGVNMHLIVTSAARTALHRGLGAAERVLEEAANGELFAFGISEPGNDAMLFDSLTTATPDGQGGYELTGVKIFTSMAGAWSQLIVHGKIKGEDEALVFGTLRRTPQVVVLDDWDAHGMRATDSRTTKLKGASLQAQDVLAKVGVGPAQDPLRFGIFGAFELLLASVYLGIGERAVQVAREGATGRRSVTGGLLQADNPVTRWRVADAAIAMDAAALQLERLAGDLDATYTPGGGVGAVNHGPRWYLQFSGVKHRVTEAALSAVDSCLRASGGRHYYRGSELERLSRDVRASIYQPSDEESVHAAYAKGLFGETGSDH